MILLRLGQKLRQSIAGASRPMPIRSSFTISDELLMSSKIYNTKRWKELRKLKLAQNPLCQDCLTLGVIEAANHVDHVQAIADGGAPFELENLRALCIRCHSRKTVYRDGGFGRQKKEYAIRAKGCDTAGIPIDPNHHWNSGGGVES